MNHLKIKTPKLLTKKGFSIPSSILGFALVSISTLGLVSYMGNFQRVKEIYSQQVQEPYDHIALIEGMKNILIQSNFKINPGAEPEYDEGAEGICRIVRSYDLYDTIKKNNAKFFPIEINRKSIEVVESHLFSEERWKYFIGNDWELTDADQCSLKNGFADDFESSLQKKCFKFNNGVIYARLSISFSQIDNEPLDNKLVNIDQVKFKVESWVTRKIPDPNNPENEQWGISAQESFVFATQVPRCSICASYVSENDDCLNLALSGSSVGSLSGDFVYNSPYAPKNLCAGEGENGDEDGALLLSHVAKNVIQSGRRNASQNSVLETVVGTNIALSCTSNIFKCKPPVGNIQFNDKDFDPYFRLNFGFNLETQGNANLEEIGINFKRGSSTIRPSKTLLTGYSSNRALRGNSKIEQVIPLQSGGNNFTYAIGSRDSVGGGGVCNTICRSPDQYVPVIRAKLKECSDPSIFTLDGNESPSTSAKVACTVCHMKNCHQYGLGTFGPLKNVRGLAGLPSEPDDGNVPECFLNENVNLTDSNGVVVDSDVSAGSILDFDGGSKKLVASNNSSEKTVCFAYGAYYTVSTDSSDPFYREDACFEVSKQRLKAGAPRNIDGKDVYTSGLLANLSIAYQGTSLDVNRTRPVSEGSSNSVDATTPTPENIKEFLSDKGLEVTNTDFYGQIPDGGVYEFYNNAAQGLFYTPLEKLPTTISGTVAVNFQTDKANIIHGGWPSLSEKVKDSNVNKGFAFFYREPFSKVSFENYNSNADGGLKERDDRPARPMFVQIPNNLNFGHVNSPSDDSSSDARPILLHHIRFKGLRSVAKGSRGLPYLCKKIEPNSLKDLFILERGPGGFGRGYEKCRSASLDLHGRPEYQFNPPTNHKEWLAALHAVAPNHPRYPFPDVFSFADGVPFLVNGKIEYQSGSFEYGSRFEGSAQFDQAILIDGGDDVGTSSRKALASVGSAWVGLIPNNTNPDIKKAEDWRQDLTEIGNLGSLEGFPFASIYTHAPTSNSQSPLEIFEKVNDVTTGPPDNPNLDFIGSLDNRGVPFKRCDFHKTKAQARASGGFLKPASYYRNPCKYASESDDLDPLKFNRPVFKSGADWACNSSNNEVQMTGDDFQKMSQSLYATGEFFQKASNTSKSVCD